MCGAAIRRLSCCSWKKEAVDTGIWIGILEAGAIAVKLEERVKRPLAQDLLHSIISDLGGRVLYVIIDDVVDNVFYAKIVLSKDGGTFEVDSRTSDALALSLRAIVPIYVEESVLQKAGFVPEPSNGHVAANEKKD